MDAEQKSKKKIFTKVLVSIFLALAVFGFVFADIEQYLPDGSEAKTIRTVNDYEITEIDVRQERDGLRQQMRAMAYNPLIQQQLIYRALENLTLKAVLKTYAQELGLVATTQEIANVLQSIEAFQDADGAFDKKIFKRLLNQQRVSVKTFTNNLSENIVREKLTQPLLADFPLSQDTADIIKQLAFTEISLEAYDASYDTLPKEFQNTTIPSMQQLEQLYSEKKSDLIRPTLKDISYVILDHNTLGDKISVTDQAVREYYDQHQKDLYFVPQKWKIFQIIFDSQEEAQKGYKSLTSGKDFKTEAMLLGHEIDDINLGFITPQELTVTDNTEAVFSHKVGEITQPIETDFGYAVYYIDAIKPEAITPFETVKKNITETLHNQKITDYLEQITLKIEDDLAGGATFDEVTTKYGSSINTQVNITPTGIIYGAKDQNLDPVVPIEYINDYTTGDDIPIIELDDHGFMLLQITEHTPSRELTFDEAQETLIKQDIKAQQNAILTQITKSLEDSDNPQEIAKEYNIKPQNYSFKRNGYIPQEVYRDGFDDLLYVKNVGEKFSDINDENALFVSVKAIIAPSKVLDEESEDFSTVLQRSYNQYIQQTSLDMLLKNAKIETNDQALANLILRELGN